MEFEQLKLDNQLCFPVYVASRLIIREYQPFLDKLGITYPQYLVLMVLWESDNISVNQISKRLILNTNTITPLLKRMETMGLIKRTRSDRDERKVIVKLTQKGKDMRIEAAEIPEQLAICLSEKTMTLEGLIELKKSLNILISALLGKNKSE